MKKKLIVGVLAVVLLLSGCKWGKNKQPQTDVGRVLQGYSYDGVPEALAAQHRIEALSVNQVSGADRVSVVNENANIAMKGFKEKVIFQWLDGVRGDSRAVSYAQKNSKGDCVGFTAYYSLQPTGGKQNNEITEIVPMEKCSEQPVAERNANEKKEIEKANELLEAAE